ncbi:MAG: hypothetical protein L0G25_03570 [Psychrobacter sp.]|nr:hypothetical protein [Psychrobacter sp.]
MKANRWIKAAEEYLDAENRKRKAKIKFLKQVLKKLSKREKELELKFAKGDGNKEKISNELALIHAHREKGLKLLKQLKKERQSAKAETKQEIDTTKKPT